MAYLYRKFRLGLCTNHIQFVLMDREMWRLILGFYSRKEKADEKEKKKI